MVYPIRTIGPEEFPGAIREIPDPPKVLYYRGTLSPAHYKKLVVVGSRAATAYGREVVDRLLRGLAGMPVSIVSGLAIGIDSLAHRTALAAGLHTISVPGSGLDDRVLHPPRHRTLAHQILDAGGALLSEFSPDFHATRWSFPQRNRIMAGMADAVLIVEAKRPSGTLITARLATEYNRELLAVPGSIFSETSAGPNFLIAQGAMPATCAEDLLEALRLPRAPTLLEPGGIRAALPPEEARLYELLAEPCERDELIRRLAMDIASANALIMRAELAGRITNLDGTYVRK